LSAPGGSDGASSSLSGTGESSLSGVRGRDGGWFSTAGSCWGMCGGSGDASCERGGGAGAVAGGSASPSRRGELGGGVSEDCRGMGDVFWGTLSGDDEEKGAVSEAEVTEGELSF
jgi:hypothetical protein